MIKRLALVLLLLSPVVSFSQLRLAPIFSDHMVLQRDQPIHFWGKARPGEKVRVIFGTQQKTGIVRPDSVWNIYLGKLKADTVGRSVIIKTDKEQIALSNVLIGDIWVCSGQSNMEWPLSREMHYGEEKKNTAQPIIRINNPPPAGRYLYNEPFKDSILRRLNKDSFYAWRSWQVCDSNSAPPMSAIAYYFASTLIKNSRVPIGLINLSIGGAPLEAFLSTGAMGKDPRFASKVKNIDWLLNDDLPQWVRERGRQNIDNSSLVNGDQRGPFHAYKPGFAYTGGIEPILPFPIRGVLWYQGESNSLEKPRVVEYRDLLRLLIKEYRSKWKQKDMPFYLVQLSSIDTTNYQSRFWPEFRNEQRLLMTEMANTGMAVCSDIGLKKDVHPKDKKTVGERLARWALRDIYGMNIVPSGPLPLKAVYEKGKLTIHFQYAAEGLQTADGKTLRGFSLDGIKEVEATIEGKVVTIATSSPPSFVYYGWSPFSEANLVNSEKLPGSTFKISVK